MPKKSTSTKTPLPNGLSQPAVRALAGAKIAYLEQLASVSDDYVRQLHGIGPNAVTKLKAALASLGLTFATNSAANSAANSATEGEVDAYIAKFPPDVRAILKRVRATIRRAAPGAKEVISYKMPAFKQHGILVYFAAWEKHIGLYPPIAGDKALQKAAARYAGPKGNLQFPLDEAIPYPLIERIVKLRVKQDQDKAAQKRRKG
jgi:uncharacterized protein YdhG (YjbR/CyaY superfamily)